jgi:class 3 adenylate cyclase/tetratricopeptide (TPR) repeat protein
MISCPACAHENPDVQKFCGECGARLPGTTAAGVSDIRAPAYTPPHLTREVLGSRFALEGERKLVTVMFCDIANSTPLAARVGAEAMHGVLNRFFELALAEVHRYEGTINQFLGDGFMALFGAPIAHEDHARRALLAAGTIHQHMRDAAGEGGPLRDVRVRMGLNTGMVVVGKIGDNLRMDYTAIGDTTNLAARLQGFAEPGTIRASDSTRRAAAAHFEFKDLGKHSLKGVAAPVPIFEPLGPRSAGEASTGAAGTQVGSVLVGREGELAALSRSLVDRREGRGSVLVIHGEPGAGKSRLVAEAKRSAGHGVLWLEGRCLSFGRGLSYWPFIDILKGAFGITETDSEVEALSKLETSVRTLFDERAPEIVPYLATVMALVLTGEHEQRVKFLDAQAMKRQVFSSTRQLAERVAQRQPVLIVLEDWHWVDQSSIALLEHLLPLAETQPITFWLTTRAEPAEPAARIKAAATANPGLRRDEITLTPLAQEHARALIDNLVGDLPEAVRAQIQRRTEGNPFFIEEVVRALIADGTFVKEDRDGGWRLARSIADLAIPDTVQGVILARIDRLEESVKSVLKLCSVIGRNFFLRVLKAIAETADNVEAGLGKLENSELIRVRQQVPEIEYIFKHALVQEAAYTSILADRRRSIHQRVAQAIESLFADRLDEFSSLLAYHYAHGEDWPKAQAYLMNAGDQAGRIAADAEALEHYRQAEATFMKLAGRKLTSLERATMARKLGQAFHGTGRYDEAVDHFSRALGHLGIRYPETAVGVLSSALKYLAAHFLGRLRAGRAKPPAMELAVAREISAVCHSLALMDFHVDTTRFALDSLIELYAGERGGDVLARVRGLSTLGITLTLFRARRLAHDRVAEALLLARESGHPAAMVVAIFARGWLQWRDGSLDDSAQSFKQSAAASNEIGDIRDWALGLILYAFVLYQRADFASTTKLAAEMVRVGENAGDPNVVSSGTQMLGLVNVAIGPLDVAAAHLMKFRELCIQTSDYRRWNAALSFLAKTRLRQGRVREAAGLMQEAMRLHAARNLRGAWTGEPFCTLAQLHLTEASSLLGAARYTALRAAERACDQALRTNPAWQAEAHRLHGTLAWLSGDSASARRRWQKGLETAERLNMPVERSRVLLEMGARLGDAALVEEARRIFEQTGAKVDLAFCLHALARIAAATRANTDAVLEHYDRAIAALDAVKAEYDLGLASRERAQLLSKLGRHDEARSDMVRADHCFAAVGADAAKIAFAS